MISSKFRFSKCHKVTTCSKKQNQKKKKKFIIFEKSPEKIRKKFRSAFKFRPELAEIIDDMDESEDKENSESD